MGWGAYTRHIVLHPLHGNCCDCIFGLRTQHQRNQRLEPLIAWCSCSICETLAAHSVHGGEVLVAHLPCESIHFLPIAGRLNLDASIFPFDLPRRRATCFLRFLG